MAVEHSWGRGRDEHGERRCPSECAALDPDQDLLLPSAPGQAREPFTQVAAATEDSDGGGGQQIVVPYLAVVGALSPDPLGAAELPARAVQLTAAATADMTTAAMLSWSQPKEAAKLASTATERFSQAAKIAAQVRQPSTTQQSLDSAVSRARFHATVQAGWALPELVRAAATTAMLADGRRARTAAGEAAVLLPEPLRRDLLKTFGCPGC